MHITQGTRHFPCFLIGIAMESDGHHDLDEGINLHSYSSNGMQKRSPNMGN